jgi:4-amino-4-deoxy-L-arabinose transferase-like glycosyltransferase
VSRRAELVAIAAISGAGLALRLYRLGDVPFGFHPDEAHNALDALRIAGGWRPAFLPGNNGREPLFMYLMAGSLATFGPTIWAARLTAALAGTLMIPIQHLFVRSLPLPRPALTGLLSAAFVAVTFWPLAQSRYALRAVLLPLWVALVLWAWWRATDPARPWPAGRLHAAAAGVFLAAAVHTHLIGRLLPIVLLASAGWLAWRQRSWKPVRPLAVTMVVAGLLALPQIQYFAQHPDSAVERADQVSILNPAVHEGDPVGTLLENAENLALAPNVHGDSSWYHNLNDRPVFDPLSGVAFLLGAALLAGNARGRRDGRARDAAVLLLATLLIGIAPSLLSVGAPNYVRLTATWPVLFLLPAWGLERVAAHLPGRRGATVAAATVAAVLVFATSTTVDDYFADYAPTAEAHEAFFGSAVERGRQVAGLGDSGTTYVSPAIWQQSIIRFLCIADPPVAVASSAGLVLPRTGVAHYAFEIWESKDAEALAARAPRSQRRTLTDDAGRDNLLVVDIPAAAWRETLPEVAGPPPPAFAGRIELLGTATHPAAVSPGSTMTVTLVWQALAPTEADRNLFVHLVDADRVTIAQWDGPPLDGSYGTGEWQPGTRVVLWLPLDIPSDARPGPTTLRLGWYDWRTGERLPLPGDDDAALEHEGPRIVTTGGIP